MPLDPQVRAMLDQAATLGYPPLEQMTPAEARAAMNARRKIQTPPPSAVASVQDRTIPGPGGDLAVRVYTPSGSGPFPLLVFIHGGGWVVGSIDTHDTIARDLANEGGCVVVSPEYRLAPEHPFPAAADDAYATTAWAAANASVLNGDASRLAVGGDSAGGNLAAVVALMARERGGPRIGFQLLLYPVTDASFDTPSYLENAEGYGLTRAGMQWYWRQYLGGESGGDNPLASPLRAPNLAGLPPAWILTAEYDPLRDEAERFADRLREAGVPVTLRRYQGMHHGFFGLTSHLDRAKDALREAGEALRSAFAVAAL